MSEPALPYAPPRGTYLDGFDVRATPMTRNVYGRGRESVQHWLEALTTSAAAVAARRNWEQTERYAVVIEIRIPWAADIDNYIKDMLDRSAEEGVFGGQDERVDLVHAIKRSRVARSEAGARMDIWLLG